MFKAVGWGERSPNEVQAAFARSTFKVFAFDDVELIGFGRTIDDGRFYANIVDVVVSPIHQRKGLRFTLHLLRTIDNDLIKWTTAR